MRKILPVLIAALLPLSACSERWSAAVRFEGGTTNPEVPIVVKVRSDQGALLFQGTLQKRCLSVRLAPAHEQDEQIHIEVSDSHGVPVGALSLQLADKQLHYLPVNGQLGVITVPSGKHCK